MYLSIMYFGKRSMERCTKDTNTKVRHRNGNIFAMKSEMSCNDDGTVICNQILNITRKPTRKSLQVGESAKACSVDSD